MNIYKRNSKHFIYMALSIGFILLLYLLLTPFLFDQSRADVNSRGLSIGTLSQKAPFNPEVNYSITSVAVENEYSIDIETYHILSWNQQVNRQLPVLLIYTLAVLLLAYSIRTRKSRYYAGDVDHRVSVLAVSMGGHAPPALCN